MSAVSYSVRDGIAILTINYGKVNALGLPVRQGLDSQLKRGQDDASVKAILLIGGGRTFPVGADISEFAKGTTMQVRLTSVIDAYEDSEKPTVAAIHGTAFGGGLEVALGCHYRVGTSNAQVGLPEVKIGLLPGAGGTQRLPRLIGTEAALPIITSGNPVPAARAKQLGILDDVISVPRTARGQAEFDLLLEGALVFTKSIVGKSLSDRRISRKRATAASQEAFDSCKATLERRQRGLLAPINAMKAVQAAANVLSFEEGMKRESELFVELFRHGQARALQYFFFAERQTMNIPGVNMNEAVALRKVGIVGAGTMGGGITMNFVQAGISVVLLEMKQEFLDKGLARIKTNYEISVKRGRFKPQQVAKWMSLIHPTLQYSDFGDVDMVIEAVFEDMGTKKTVFRTLDRVTKPDAILASNTSTLNIDEIASVTSRPEHVIGTHFFSPANIMRLLENVRGAKSSDRTIATVMKMSKQIGKVGVLVGNCWAFVGNRMMDPYRNAASSLIYEGASPYDIDRALYDFGFAMGIFAVGDLAGNDIGYSIRKSRGLLDPKNRDQNVRYTASIADRICELGRFGQKSGKGWYLYKPGQRRGVEDPEVLKIIDEISRQEGYKKRNITKEEIIERCLFALANEGFKILEEGIAAKPSDIDVVWVYGYGFPRHRGGPMFYAESVGLKKVHKALQRFSEMDPLSTHWKPAKLLTELVTSKQSLTSYWRKKMKKTVKSKM